MTFSLFQGVPSISKNDFRLKKEKWINYETGEERVIHRYFNGYEKGLLKKERSDDYWNSILKNCQYVKDKLEKSGDFFYYNFHLLPENRSLNFNFDFSVSESPISFETVFVSGFLLSKEKIKKMNSGFFMDGDKPLSFEAVSEYLSVKKHFPMFVFNLGYYYTKSLLSQKVFGYDQTRKRLNLQDETIGDQWLSFLGMSVNTRSRNNIGSFPLFNKSLLSFGRERKLLIKKSFEFGKGSIRVLNNVLSWGEEDVNDSENISKKNTVIFTPSFKNNTFSHEKNWEDFSLFVGENRVNFLILNKGVGLKPKSYLVKLKKGKLLMPPMGGVISLSKDYFYEKFGKTWGDRLDERGIIDFNDEEVSFELELPNNLFQNLDFAYGGFLPLMINEVDFTKSENTLEKLMLEQGFFHPLSRQSQETPIDKPYAREPRSVLVTVEDKNGNEEYGCFSFSGRYEETIGVNIFEIVQILKRIVPKSKKIKNVIHLDSGSAVKLIYFEKINQPRILNLTALSSRSFTGKYSKNIYNLVSFSL